MAAVLGKTVFMDDGSGDERRVADAVIKRYTVGLLVMIRGDVGLWQPQGLCAAVSSCL